MKQNLPQLIENFIRTLIAENIKDASFTNDTDLLENGLVDSLFIIDLVLFLEKEFLNHQISLKRYSKNDFNTINKCIEILSNEMNG